MTNFGPIHFWPSWFWPGQFGPIQFLANPFRDLVCVMAPKGGAQTHKKSGTRRVDGPKISRFFFSFPASHVRSFCLSLGVFSWNFLSCFRRPALTCARLEFSGCRVKPRRLRGRRTLAIFFTDFGQSDFGQTDFGQTNFDRVWPTLIDRLWPTFGWPTWQKLVFLVSRAQPQTRFYGPDLQKTRRTKSNSEGWGPERWEAQNFAFFPLPPPFRSFCVSLGVFSWNFGGFLKRRA